MLSSLLWKVVMGLGLQKLRLWWCKIHLLTEVIPVLDLRFKAWRHMNRLLTAVIPGPCLRRKWFFCNEHGLGFCYATEGDLFLAYSWRASYPTGKDTWESSFKCCAFQAKKKKNQQHPHMAISLVNRTQQNSWFHPCLRQHKPTQKIHIPHQLDWMFWLVKGVNNSLSFTASAKLLPGDSLRLL